MKKLFTLITAGGLFVAASSYGQDFEIYDKPVTETTTGVTPYEPGADGGHFFVEMNAYVKNLSSDTLVYKWRNLSTDTTQNPIDWVLVGVCDNNGCYAEYGSWYYGDTITSGPEGPGNVMDMFAHVYAPTTSADGTGTYKIEISTENQTDTAVFILTKGPVSIDLVRVTDKRVNLYPNPAQDDITLYVDRGLKARSVEIYNIIGKQFGAFALSSASEVTQVPVANLSSGIYMMRVLDVQGQVITTRKFTKN